MRQGIGLLVLSVLVPLVVNDVHTWWLDLRERHRSGEWVLWVALGGHIKRMK